MRKPTRFTLWTRFLRAFPLNCNTSLPALSQGHGGRLPLGFGPGFLRLPEILTWGRQGPTLRASGAKLTTKVCAFMHLAQARRHIHSPFPVWPVCHRATFPRDEPLFAGKT